VTQAEQPEPIAEQPAQTVESDAAQTTLVAGELTEKITVPQNTVRQRRADAPARTRAEAEQVSETAKPVLRPLALEQAFSKVRVTESAERDTGEQRPATESASRTAEQPVKPVPPQRPDTSQPAVQPMARQALKTQQNAQADEKPVSQGAAVRVEPVEFAAADAPQVAPIERADAPETVLSEHRHDMPVQPVATESAQAARFDPVASRPAQALQTGTQLSPEQLVEQIHELRESLAPGRSRELRIRLNPPELGEVMILARRQGESVSATIVARTEEAHRAISERLDHFRAQLAADGDELKAVDVRLDFRSADGRQTQGGGAGSHGFQESSEGSQRSLAERLEWTLASGGGGPSLGESEEQGFAHAGPRQLRRGATVEFVA